VSAEIIIGKFSLEFLLLLQRSLMIVF